MSAGRLILGIDPGLRRTGWGLVEARGARLIHRGSGVIRVPEAPTLAPRLLFLVTALRALLAAERPEAAAIEETFVNKDAGATLKLGAARAACLIALAEAGLDIGEYAPNLVKKALVGAGHAEKAQIRLMVGRLLGLKDLVDEDAADALAIAITHAHRGFSPALGIAAAAREVAR